MTEEPKKVKVTVKDKRRSSAEVGAGSAADPSSEATSPAEVEHDYLDDLRRLQAEFENYRKRMMKEQSAVERHARARIVERLLPILDNFERAIAHGEGGDGVALVFKELKAALEAEGLEEIPAEGLSFDPTMHEAVESLEDESVTEPTVRSVYRRGYRFGDQVLRAAMVVVARPAETEDEVSTDGAA